MAGDQDDLTRGMHTRLTHCFARYIGVSVAILTVLFIIQLGLPTLPDEAPAIESLVAKDGEPTQVLKDLHVLLLETAIESGKLVCANCEHEYAIKEGIANFLLPSHLV